MFDPSASGSIICIIHDEVLASKDVLDRWESIADVIPH
jgi:hypothetical protein